jgi:hypothetical protein
VIKKTALHPDGAIFARGACDDKGQMFMHIKALEVMEQNGGLPCNIKFMIEGEEEVGSDNLEHFVRANPEKLANDVILISDTGMLGKRHAIHHYRAAWNELCRSRNYGTQSRFTLRLIWRSSCQPHQYPDPNDCFASRRKEPHYHPWFLR